MMYTGSLPMWERGLKRNHHQVGDIRQRSLPMWERGLKRIRGRVIRIRVAPHVGAWVETTMRQRAVLSSLVAPRVGAWIETGRMAIRKSLQASLPVWERGLKPTHPTKVLQACSVAPRVGAWIETRRFALKTETNCRSPCGSVD